MTVSTNFDDVGTFHYRFGLRAVNYGGAGPNVTAGREDEERRMLDDRVLFLHEELREYVEAIEDGDDARQFDALLDLVWVAMGTAHLSGFPWQRGWNLVQAANMAKERMDDGEDFKSKIGKPPGWQPPDIEGLLAEYGF